MAAKTTSFENNSTKTVTPLSGANTSDTDPKQGYEQTLTQLTFQGGSKTIGSGSETLMLPENQPIVNLLVSEPSVLFPVLSTSVGPDYAAPGGWPKPLTPVEITSDQSAAITQALTFRQNIMAAPSSKLATDFQAAMKAAQAEKNATAMIDKMNAFFKAQSSYSKVTYPDYTAVQSYLQAFAQMWVQKNSASGSSDTGAKYYVYSAPDAGKKGATSEGTIQATKKSGAPANADPTDHLSGYKISFTSSGGPATPLSYDGGSFSDGGPIQLSATYGYAGRFNGKVSDVQLWPILVGTIQSKQVIAIPLSPESGWDKFWSSLSFSKLFKYFMEAMGLWMALDFLKSKLSSKEKSLDEAKEKNKGSEPTDEQVKDADATADKTGTNDATANSEQGKSISGDESFDVPTSDKEISSATTETRTASSDALNNIAEDNTNGAIEQTGQTLEDMAKIETTPAMEAAGNDLQKAGEAMSADPPDIAEASTNLKSANDNLKIATDELGGQISEEQKQAFENEIEANKEAAEEAEEQDEDGDNAGEGDDPEGEGDMPEIPEV